MRALKGLLGGAPKHDRHARARQSGLEPGRAVADVGVVGLRQQGDDGRALVRHAQQQEAEVEHGGAAHVVADVADGVVQQLLQHAVVGGAPVRHADHKHAAIPAAHGDQPDGCTSSGIDLGSCAADRHTNQGRQHHLLQPWRLAFDRSFCWPYHEDMSAPWKEDNSKRWAHLASDDHSMTWGIEGAHAGML